MKLMVPVAALAVTVSSVAFAAKHSAIETKLAKASPGQQVAATGTPSKRGTTKKHRCNKKRR